MSSAIKKVLCKTCLILIIGFTFLTASYAHAQQQTVVLRVDGDNGSLPPPQGTADGSAWGTAAFRLLQDALAEAEEILVEPDTTVELWVAATDPSNPYRPDRDANTPFGTGARFSTFRLDFNNVQLLGGFAGDEIDPDDRDPALYITILSGELIFEGCGDPGAGDCFENNGTQACDDLCFGQDCPGCCELVCDLDPFCCHVEWNQNCANLAMGLCSPPLADDPSNAYHVVTASGVDVSVRIDGFTITNGLADAGSSGKGAGMVISSASLAVVRVTFTGNAAPVHGGAMHIQGTSDPIVVNTSFIGNSGMEAGALHTEDGMAGGTFVNCLFSRNTSDSEGGAINPGGGVTLTFINCTLVDNTVLDPLGGGAIFTEPRVGAVILTNCILWGNRAGNDPNQIQDPIGVVTVTYSDVEGGWGVPMDMNIDDDPLFVDPVNGDYRLTIDSPCIDFGNNDDVPCDQFDLDNDGITCDEFDPENNEGTPDLDLINRVLPGDPNGEAIVDMGSYEFRHPDVCSCPDICPADFDGSCDVGVKDLLFLLGAWGPCDDCADCPADLVVDCDVGVKDLLFLLGAWGPCPCGPGPPPPLSFEQALADVCLTEDHWEDFEDVMADPDRSQADKDNYLCWMTHYLDACTNCFCPHSLGICPGPDPFD